MADRKIAGRRDIILLAIVLIVGGICALVMALRPAAQDGIVEITVDGAVYQQLPLSEDAEVEIKGYGGGENHLIIKGGLVHMESASCPDGICVRHRSISKDGESIICLPNRVVVTIYSREEGSVDAVA